IGIDGFDWRLTDPLVAAGRMPNLQRLEAAGTRADLLTLVPLEKSPVIWTTIATGRLPIEGGRGFLVSTGEDGDGPQAYTTWYRTTRAFWNILTDRNVRVSVLGWLESWPAEVVNGTMVTDYVKYFAVEGDNNTVSRTYPEALYDEIRPLVVFPADVTDADLAPLVGEPERMGDERAREGIDALRWIRAGDLTFTKLAEHFLDERPEDVMAVYLRGPDAVCHQFWGDRDLAAAGDDGFPSRQFGPTVDRYFEATDALLGRILERIDLAETSVLLVSDHGFQGPRRGLDGAQRQGIYMHRELGTILLAGPWAAGEGLRVEGCRVQDVLPTLLHALELPVGRDLDGEVATALLGPAGGGERAVEFIPTYEITPLARTAEPPESPVSEEIQERLDALGYVE
ncbi:MAG: hypothetical protein HKN12_05790, partial [Gemmatimonadetes bacterium]|nr:hypothetical protein [Gemmatimonadota bacterium]